MKLKCHKCKSTIGCENVVADGKFNSVKGKVYCMICFWTKERKEDMHKNSVSLMEFIKEGI